MPKIGDKVIVSGTKIGNPTREGTLIGMVGPLINVRWSDGTVSLFKPGAGSVSFESGNGGRAVRPAPAKKPVARKPVARKPVARKAVAAKPAPKKQAARRPAPKAAPKKRSR